MHYALICHDNARYVFIHHVNICMNISMKLDKMSQGRRLIAKKESEADPAPSHLKLRGQEKSLLDIPVHDIQDKTAFSPVLIGGR